MRKILLIAFIIISVASCKTEDPKPKTKDIIAVQSLAYIHVSYGTEFSAVPFPAKVTVKYSDNTTEEITVTFSTGTYSPTVVGTYVLDGTLTLTGSTTNTMALKATAHVVVSPVRLKTISQETDLLYEYFYDTLDRLDHFTIDASSTTYYYSYASDNKVIQRVRKLSGNDYPEKYYYTGDALNKIEFYYGDNILSETHTYTYTSGKITSYDNSNKSIVGLKHRDFEYDADGNVSKVSFDSGNPWNYTYLTDKTIATPLILDPADPQNQVANPIATFTYVTLSSYTSEYTYNAWGYPTKETRTYPGDGNKQINFFYTY
ncbi:MAG TPA: Ig-like domain-containing protein [Cyclobacteriaceae bacterium]|nr:Ig-like domain-containing protein [Cyclobacteriaceae bacterium]